MVVQERPTVAWPESWRELTEEAGALGALNMERRLCVEATQHIMKAAGVDETSDESPFEDFLQPGVRRTHHYKTAPINVTFPNNSSTKYILGKVWGQCQNPEESILKKVFSKHLLFGYVYAEDLEYDFDVGESNGSRTISVPLADYGHSLDLPRDGIEDATKRRQNIRSFVSELELVTTSLGVEMPVLADFNPHRLYS